MGKVALRWGGGAECTVGGQQRVVFFSPPFHTTNGFVLSVGGFNHEGDGYWAVTPC